MYEFADTGKSGTYFGGTNGAMSGSSPAYRDYDVVTFTNIEKFQTLNYFTFTLNGTHGYELNGDLMDTGRHEFSYEIGLQSGDGVVYVERGGDKTKFTVFLNDWNVDGLTGAQHVVFPFNFIKQGHAAYDQNTGSNPDGLEVVLGYKAYYNNQYNYEPYPPINTHLKTSYTSGTEWKNHIIIEELPDAPLGGNLITLKRDYGDTAYSSVISIVGSDETILYTNEGNSSVNELWYGLGSVERVDVRSLLERTYTFPISGGTDPNDQFDVIDVTVYVQNSQTGALLADARLSILAAAGGTETEIINATLPGGTATYTLQPTGGGSPNPDYYRAVATVPGFSQIIENHSFTLNGPHDVIIEMRPDSGGPLDPERAYLEFYVRDLNANPIPSASVQCGSRIQQTNSAGYAVFEVAKNASHPWIAKKSGYVTIEGTATTGPNPRYVVNVVLGPKEIPTNPPATDPAGPGATPTPDRRTNEQKGQAVIDMIADNAEGIGALALICLLLGLLKLMVKW